MATVLNNALVTFKDSRWLTLEVCREYQRNKCTRTDTECKYAHPLPHVEIQNGRVTACFDSIKGRCNREKPPCKYLHPPQHLKEQLLVNGRNNLALKNAALMGQIAAFSPFLPATLTPGAVGATTLGACPLTCSVTAPTSPPPPYLPPSGQPGAPTLISLGAGEANHHGGPGTPLGYALNFHHPSTATHPRAASQFLTALPPPGQPGAAPAAYQLILNHHPAAASYQTAGAAAKAALTRSPYLNGCQPIENGAPTGPTLFLHNGTAITLAATGLINPSGGPTLMNGIPVSYCINASNGKTSLNPFQHRQDRMEVCREYQRGNCKRSMTECKYAHPPDHVLVDGHTSTVTVCIDALKGRCTRGEQQCRYFHPPTHPSQQQQQQQQITYHQQQQQLASSAQHVQYHHVTDTGNGGGTVVVAMSTAPPNPELIMTTNGLPPGPVVVLASTPQRLSVDATAFRPTDLDAPTTRDGIGLPLNSAPNADLGISPLRPSTGREVEDAPPIAITDGTTLDDDPNHRSSICNGVNESGEEDSQQPTTTLGSEHRPLEAASEDAKNTFITTAAAHVTHHPPPPPSSSPTNGVTHLHRQNTHHHHQHNASIAATTTISSHKTPNPTAASDGPRAKKRARQDQHSAAAPTALYYNSNELAGPAYVVCSVAGPTVTRVPSGPTPLYSLYLPPHALQFHGVGLDASCAAGQQAQPQQQQLYLHYAANAASNYLAAPMSAMLGLQAAAPQSDPERGAAIYDSNGAQLYNGHHQQHHAAAQHYYHQAATPGPAAQAQIIYAPPGATTHHLIQHGHHPHPGTFQPPHHFIPVAFASPATANGLPPY